LLCNVNTRIIIVLGYVRFRVLRKKSSKNKVEK